MIFGVKMASDTYFRIMRLIRLSVSKYERRKG